jgi:hypothetical protein
MVNLQELLWSRAVELAVLTWSTVKLRAWECRMELMLSQHTQQSAVKFHISNSLFTVHIYAALSEAGDAERCIAINGER